MRRDAHQRRAYALRRLSRAVDRSIVERVANATVAEKAKCWARAWGAYWMRSSGGGL